MNFVIQPTDRRQTAKERSKSMAHAAKLPTHSSEHVMMQHHGQLEHERESQHARQQQMVEREGRSVAPLPLPPHPHYHPVKSHHHLPPFPPPPHFGFPAPHHLAAHHHVPFPSPRGELQHSHHSKPLPFALPTEGLKSEMEDEKDFLSGRSNPHDHHVVVKHEDGRLYLGCKKEGCNGILLVEPTTHHGAPYQCPRCLNKQKYCQDCQQLYINFRRHRTLGHELYEFQRKRQVRQCRSGKACQCGGECLLVGAFMYARGCGMWGCTCGGVYM